ncbi:MAG: nitrate- and nitrite sensing domain-containing protein [Gallionellaceae bacterium]
MIISIVFVAVLLSIYLILNVVEKNRSKRKRELQLRGLNVLRQALELLTNVQQHRGISAAMLSGDKSFAQRLMGKRNDIEKIFSSLEPVLAEIPELNSDSKSLAAIHASWSQMSSSIVTMTPEQSFAKHTDLIRKTIHLIGDMGEHIGMLDGEGAPLALMSNILLLRIPLLMESIGQARALGSGYAAKGKCGAVGRIRLSFLEQHIRECQHEIRSSMTENSPAMERVNSLLKVLNERFLHVEEINIAPDTLFRTATEAIEACLGLWQDVAQKTVECVETRA